MVEKSRLQSNKVQVEDSIDAINNIAYQRGWTDGLPIVPPTPERVERMLEYVGRDPAEAVAELEPSCGVANIEKIAINAVMAGCLPEYLPVLIAAVEAMSVREFNLCAIQTTTNPVTPMTVVNGPIVSKLGINCGRNALGPGNRANATIGRAIRLILLNIGGAIPDTVSKAVLGFPGRYTFCLGENEKESPWEPLHVERGFDASVSAVTMFGVQGTTNILCGAFAIEDGLRVIANAMSYMGGNNVLQGGGCPVVVLTTGYAQGLAQLGFSKREVKRFLYEHSGFPASDLLPMVKQASMKEEISRCIVNNIVRPARRLEDIMIVVAGGPEPYHATFLATFGNCCPVTRPIRGKATE